MFRVDYDEAANDRCARLAGLSWFGCFLRTRILVGLALQEKAASGAGRLVERFWELSARGDRRVDVPEPAIQRLHRLIAALRPGDELR